METRYATHFAGHIAIDKGNIIVRVDAFDSDKFSMIAFTKLIVGSSNKMCDCCEEEHDDVMRATGFEGRIGIIHAVDFHRNWKYNI